MSAESMELAALEFSTTMAAELAALKAAKEISFSVKLLELDTSMVSLRIDDEKFQNLCKNNYLIGKKVDELKNMIDESANKIDVAFKQVELLEGEAALAAQKKDDSQGKLDVKIKNNKEKLKAVRMEINSAKLEIDSMKLEPLLKKKADLKSKIAGYNDKKSVSDFKLEEELKAANEKLMEKKAELEEERNKHSHLQGIMELASKAMSDCKESMELVQQIICLRLKAVSKKLQGTKVRYIIFTEMADLHVIGHICNNAKSFHHFSLKFNIGRSLHTTAEALLSENIGYWSKNEITSVGAGKVYKISVNEDVVKFSTLNALEAQEAGFKI